MNLSAFLRQFFEFTSELDTWIADNVDEREYPKGTLLLEMDNLSNKIFFIERGLARTFYYKDGKDITHFFFKEGEISMPIESIFFKKPSPYALELLENSRVATVNYRDFESLKEIFPVLEKVQGLLMTRVLDEFSERLFAIQFQSAKERYEILINRYPDIILRTPLGHIASYIGITQQTLSVIRSQM